MPLVSADNQRSPWPMADRVLFRFFFVYFLLNISPWTWLDGKVPGVTYLTRYYYNFINWSVDVCNTLFYHVERTTVINNGSGDTSQHWKTVFTVFLISVTASLVWSLLDRKRSAYYQAAYWLRTFIRYYLISNCLVYGLYKLFALQMSFPNLSQLATPLGDFLPMRLSWMFIGYSTPYQVFSGVMEILAGLLLLNRRTITLGLFVATAIFINVMVMNLSYDIPVKLFSIHLVLYCLYLLFTDAGRLVAFFILNRPAGPNTIYQASFPKKWMRITRVALKLAFILLFVVMPFFEIKSYTVPAAAGPHPIGAGIYDVVVFAVNSDTLPPAPTDTLRWRDMIFEQSRMGSVGSTDTAFRQRYRRGYFNFEADTIKNTIGFKKFSFDTTFMFSLRYALPDSNTVILTGARNRDSLYVVLKRSRRHFQLTEKQFHWVSEANR